MTELSLNVQKAYAKGITEYEIKRSTGVVEFEMNELNCKRMQLGLSRLEVHWHTKTAIDSGQE